MTVNAVHNFDLAKCAIELAKRCEIGQFLIFEGEKVKWKIKSPRVPGWYFYQRTNGNYPVRCGYVKYIKYRLDEEPYLTICHTPIDDVGFMIAALTTPHRWAGPIPEPEE